MFRQGSRVAVGTTKEVTIVKNGIDTKRFGFDPIKRNEVRND